MRTTLLALSLFLALPTLAQRPVGNGTLSGLFTTGVTPENRQVDEKATIFYELRIAGKPWRYPALVVIDSPGHFFRFVCKAKNIPTDVLLTDIKLVIVEPGNKTSLCLPSNFDGRAVLLSSTQASVVVDDRKRRARKPGRLKDSVDREECPVGLRSISGLLFGWVNLK
jgi:hypothetical protein